MNIISKLLGNTGRHTGRQINPGHRPQLPKPVRKSTPKHRGGKGGKHRG